MSRSLWFSAFNARRDAITEARRAACGPAAVAEARMPTVAFRIGVGMRGAG